MPLAQSTKTPQFSLEEIFGGPGASPGTAPARVLAYGSMIAVALSTVMNNAGGALAPVVTAAGTAPTNTPTQVFSPADAAAKFGSGSELHRDAVAAFAADPQCNLWGVAVPESGGARAAVTFTPTVATTISAPGTLRVVVCGRFVDVPFGTADTPSTIGLAVATAINNQGDWPVTATNVWATGVVTVTAKQIGPRGNYLSFRCYLISSTQTLAVTAGALTGTLLGLQVALSAGAGAGGLYRLAGGTTDDAWATALAAVAAAKFDRQAAPAYLSGGTPSANLALLAAQLDTQGGLPQMFGQQAVVGANETLGNATAISSLPNGLNRARCQVVWHRFTDDTPGEIAAAVAAGRLAGDGALGGALVGEAFDPAANLNGLELALRAAPVLADQLQATEIETALNTGLSPVVPSNARPGAAALVAAITSRSADPVSGLPSYAVFKCKAVGVTDWVRDALVADLRTTYRGFRLVADAADGTPPKQPRVVTPRTVKKRLYGDLKGYEERGYVTAVDAHAGELTCAINAGNPSRLDLNVPCVPTPDFDIGTGQLRQESP